MGIRPRCKPKKPSREQAITNLLDSIAQEEVAIAHLIKAEAAKTERSVSADCYDPDRVVEIQDKVVQTMQAAIKFQMLLQFKLDQVASLEKKKPKIPYGLY